MGKVSSYWATGFHFPRSAFGWQWRYTKAISHCVRADKRLIHGQKKQFLCNSEAKVYQLFSSLLSESFKQPSREKKDISLHKPCRLCLFNSCTVFMIHQVILHVLPRAAPPSFHHNFLFYPLLPKSSPETQHSPCWKVFSFEESNPGLFLQQTTGMDNTSLSSVSALMFMEVPDWALQTEVLCFQNWFSSGGGSGYASWILERDMSVFAFWSQPWDWCPTFWYLGYGLWLVEMQQTHWLI